jgi:flagellar operon protein
MDDFRIQPEQNIRSTAQVNSAGSASPAKQSGKTQGGQSFSEVLSQVQEVQFSNHAQKRLESRQISLTPDSVSRLSDAVDRAEKRGGQSSLVLMDDLAFLVNVPRRLVVTAVDANSRGEGVFTQIDSVVLAEPSQLTDASKSA